MSDCTDCDEKKISTLEMALENQMKESKRLSGVANQLQREIAVIKREKAALVSLALRAEDYEREIMRIQQQQRPDPTEL